MTHTTREPRADATGLSRTALTRRYAVLTGLRWLPTGMMLPIMVLTLQARGADLGRAGAVMALYSLVTLALELPTGAWSDVIGRRPVLMVAGAFAAAGAAVFGLSGHVAGAAVGVALLAVSRALGSGPLEAWYVEQVRRREPGVDVSRGLATGSTVGHLAIGVGSVVGGALPGIAVYLASDLPVEGTAHIIALSMPSLAAATVHVVFLVAVGALVVALPTAGRAGAALLAGVGADTSDTSDTCDTADTVDTAADRTAAPVRGGTASTARAGVALALQHRDLRLLLIHSVLLGVTLAGVELLAPGQFAALSGGAHGASGVYGAVLAGAFVAAAAGSWVGPRLAPRIGGVERAFLVVSALSVPLVAAIGWPAGLVAAISFVGLYFLFGCAEPLFATITHDRVGDGERATMLSIQSLAMQTGGMVASLGAGALVAVRGLTVGFIALALVFSAAAAVLLGLRQRPGV